MDRSKANWSDHLLNFVSVILGVSLAFIISNKSEQARTIDELQENLAGILDELEEAKVLRDHISEYQKEEG